MNKKIITFLIIAFTIMMVFAACTEIDPLGVANGVPEGYDPDAIVDNGWIYFVEVNEVGRMRLDGTGVESMFTLPFAYTSKIQLDPVRQKIYILNQDPALDDSIYGYNLDGSGEQLLFSQAGIDNIWDMTNDYINGFLYFTYKDGIKSINTNNTGSIADVFSSASVFNTNTVYVTPDYKGGVYYFSANFIYKVLTIASSNVLPLTPAPVIEYGGLSYNLADDSLYYFDFFDWIRKLPIGSGDAIDVAQTLGKLNGNMVVYQPDGKIFFYDDNGSLGPYILYNINIDGTGTKQEILNNGSTLLNSFDILAK